MYDPHFQNPSLQQAFGTSYYGTSIVAYFLYDVSNSVLYSGYPTLNYDVFLGVPLTVANLFAVAQAQLGGVKNNNPNIPWPDDIYNNQVAGNYRQCLLCENGAPLLAENGNYITVN